MNWSVVSQRKSDKGAVFDVVCRGGSAKRMGGVGQYKVTLVGSKVNRHLGTVVKNDVNYGRETWAAVPYALYPKTINGFSRRRDAINYMLKDQGYHWDENATRSAGQLNMAHIGTSIIYTFHNEDDEIDSMTIGPIDEITHDGEWVNVVEANGDAHILPWSGVIREER